jgi:hypothetical protein
MLKAEIKKKYQKKNLNQLIICDMRLEQKNIILKNI